MSESEIKVIDCPTVRLVGKQIIDQAELDRFLGDHDVESWETDTEVAGEKLAEVAGRLCYLSFAKKRPGGNSAYLGHILESGHGSVCEHAVYNFIITGVSRSFTHELVRHRAGTGFSQLSQRFVDESSADFVMPPIMATGKLEYDTMQAYKRDAERGMSSDVMPPRFSEHGQIYELWHDSVSQSLEAYRKISDGLTRLISWQEYDAWKESLPKDTLSNGFKEWMSDRHTEQKTSMRKRAREAARSVLPNATETKIFVTANGRSLRHIIEMRGHWSADAEIRDVAFELLRIMQVESPNLFGDYKISVHDGVGFIDTENRKV